MVIACAGPERPVGEAGENGQDANTDANRIWLSDPDAEGRRWWMIGETKTDIAVDGKAEIFFVDDEGKEIFPGLDEDGNSIVHQNLFDLEEAGGKVAYIANQSLDMSPIAGVKVRYDSRFSFDVDNFVVACDGAVLTDGPGYSSATSMEGTSDELVKKISIYGPAANPISFNIKVVVYNFDRTPEIDSATGHYGDAITATQFVPTANDQGKNSAIPSLSNPANITYTWYKKVNGGDWERVAGPTAGNAGTTTTASKKGTYRVGVRAEGFREKFSNEIDDLEPIFNQISKMATYLNDNKWTSTLAAPEDIQLRVLVGGGSVGQVPESILRDINTGKKYITLNFTGSTAYNNLAVDTFAGCDYLVGLDLGASIITVDDKALYKCENLATIAVAATNTGLQVIDNVLYTKSPKELLFYPVKKTTIALVVAADVKVIRTSAVAFNDYIRELEIKGTDIEIQKYAFENLNNLEKVTFYPLLPVENDYQVLQQDAFKWFGYLEDVILANRGHGVYERVPSANPGTARWQRTSVLP
jgi:hypothetical protein